MEGRLPVIERYGNGTVLLLDESARERFAVAVGYDERDGSYEALRRHDDLLLAVADAIDASGCEHVVGHQVAALLAADCTAIEQSAVWWCRGDVAEAIEAEGADPDDALVDDILDDIGRMEPWRDDAVARGRDLLEATARFAVGVRGLA